MTHTMRGRMEADGGLIYIHIAQPRGFHRSYAILRAEAYW